MRRAMPEATTVKRLRFPRGEERTVKAAEPRAKAPARPKRRIVERAMMKRWEVNARLLRFHVDTFISALL